MKKIIYLSIFILLLSGCKSNTATVYVPSSAVKEFLPKDTNLPQTVVMSLKGKPAEDFTLQLARNMETKQAVVNKIYKYNGFLYAFLIVLLVGGLAFWWLTKSRFGFVVPLASLAGLVLIYLMTAWAGWFCLGAVVIALAVFIWRGVEWQKERNEAKPLK